jgi:hypothetical protein
VGVILVLSDEGTAPHGSTQAAQEAVE